jgi:N6-L-threonylcarbamoyladenine synthase
MKILGIETSCDETAAAVVDDTGTILGEIVRSQFDDHAPFGGIVPEIAARAHLETIDSIIAETLRRADTGFDGLDAVAATGGPGLIGGVIVGVMTAKAIAAARDIPFIAVNHLEAHALTARMTDRLEFPYLVLLVSGGHTQLLIAEGVGRFRRLGTTVDDAVGEAFDKTAKMLGLGYPGGPMVEKLARKGDAKRFALPRPMKGRPGCDFSFSGLKTAVRHAVEALPEWGQEEGLNDQDIADLCASFQQAAADALMDRTRHAIEIFTASHGTGALVVGGGVAANSALRGALEILCAATAMRFVAPPQKLCTDNGAMIAWAGIERLRLGLTDGLDFAPRPRWPLDPDAPKRAFAGAKA